MNLPKFSVSRPVTTWMVFTGIVIFGWVSLRELPQELFPEIVYPQLTVVAPYANAAPEEIETLITRPIEEAVGTVAGLKRLRSLSKEGLCMVIADFGWDQNINFAALGIREKLDLIKERLPREAEEPVVLQYNPFERPILTLSITTSGDRSPVSLRELTRRMIKDEMEKVEGVASATISGGLEREILVEIDRDRLSARSIPILDVTKSITNANINYPAGTIKESFYEYLVRTLGEFEHVSDIEKVAIGREEKDSYRARQQEMLEESEKRGYISRDKRLIYLKDVARVIDGLKERTSYSRYNGRENISLSIQKQALGNTVKTINRAKEKLKELKNDLPEDIEITVVYDQSLYIKESINGVRNAALQGGILVFFVLLYFLRSWSSAAIVIFTIPISVMVTFALMYMWGVSMNMMSLGGLAFGVGMLVDSAVVVVENIFRHMQMGEGRKVSSVDGTNEVFMAVTGSILTTVVVFLPLIFVIGIIGQITKDFALTVTFSLLMSLFAAVSIVPMLASRWTVAKQVSSRTEDQNSSEHGEEGRTIRAIRKFYSNLLGKYINRRGRYFLFTLVIFLLSIFLFIVMDKELMPKVDQGQFMVRVDLPAGTKLAVTNRVEEEIEKHILTIPEIESINATVGSTRESTVRHVAERLTSSQAEITVNLKEKRKLSSSDVVQMIKNRLTTTDLEGTRMEYVLQENVLTTGLEAPAPVTIEIKGNKLKVLEELTKRVQGDLGEIEGVYGIKNNLSEPSPETKIYIDKDKASLYGLSVVDIAQTAQIALKGFIPTKFKEGGREYDIRVRLRKEDRDDFNKLSRIQLQSPLGMSIPLSSVASFGMGKGPSEIKRLNQERVVTIYGNIYKRPQKDVIADVNDMIAKLEIPKDYTVKLTGESEAMKASFQSLQFALIAAVLLVYMIMAAIFESLWQPFVILFTIPLSLIGVAWALLITRTSISAYVLMGMGILCGIVVNNAIVLIDCINLFHSRGMGVREAVVNASAVRLRPILMTAITTVLGLLPMAFLGGKGAELRAPIAITAMGGLIVATFLTLIVKPAIYLTYTEFLDRIFKRKR